MSSTIRPRFLISLKEKNGARQFICMTDRSPLLINCLRRWTCCRFNTIFDSLQYVEIPKHLCSCLPNKSQSLISFYPMVYKQPNNCSTDNPSLKKQRHLNWADPYYGKQETTESSIVFQGITLNCTNITLSWTRQKISKFMLESVGKFPLPEKRCQHICANHSCPRF